MATVAKKKSISQRQTMSYEDYLELTTDTQIVEWVAGEVITYMPPIDVHQDISLFLTRLLASFIEVFDLGKLRYAPLEVKLWPNGPSREPDIFFVTKENQHKLTQKRFEGAPDLIIEIISPSSVTEDRVRKFSHYEQAGVKEYWLIDPRLHQQQVDFYILGEDNQFYAAPLTDDGRYFSTILPDFWFDIDWLWQESLPNTQLTLSKIMISIDQLPVHIQKVYQALHDILNNQTQ